MICCNAKVNALAGDIQTAIWLPAIKAPGGITLLAQMDIYGLHYFWKLHNIH